MKKNCKIILIAIFLGASLKLFFLDLMITKGDSMFPCIKNGDVVFVLRCAYGFSLPFSGKRFFSWKKVKKGDVVIYFYKDKQVVKRCVAVENEKIKVLKISQKNSLENENSKNSSKNSIESSVKTVYNEDDFKNESDQFFLQTEEFKIPLDKSQYEKFKNIFLVPKGYILAIGDNFSLSVDSREYGFVCEKNVIGKVLWK